MARVSRLNPRATGIDVLVADAKRNMVNGRPVVATRLGRGGSTQSPQNAPSTFRVRHTTAVACSDLRLIYGAPLSNETDGATQSVTIKVGLEYAGTVYPVSWSGKSTTTFDPGGVAVTSDPIPVEMPAGATFWTRCYVSTVFGSYTTLTTTATSGTNTLSLLALPGGGVVGLLDVESPREQVNVLSYSGSSSPYTANLAANLASTHATGSVVGGTTFSNVIARADWGESSVNSVTDNSWTTTTLAVVNALGSTTLTANANPGDTTIKVANAVAMFGNTWTIGAESLSVRNVGGASSPYTAYLNTPVVGTYTSGATVTGGLGTASAIAPVAIVADRAAALPTAPILLVGDSLPDGVGYNLAPTSSYATVALESAGRPYYAITKAGESAQQFAAPATSRRRRTYASLASWAFYEYGVNDIYGSRTLAQVQADTTTIIGWLKQRGLKVAIATLTPRTTSTDGWLTTGNQTIVSTGTFDAIRKQYNAWVRAGAGGLADLVVELADAAETARDSGIWKADASGPYTVDGIHPTYVGHTTLLQPVFAAALAQMV